jgi:hydrogenase nickel incorporation protein HypA/HybF
MTDDNSFIKEFIQRVELAARQQGAKRITAVNVKLGARCQINANYLTFHFLLASQGTLAEGAQLHIQAVPDPKDPHAQDLILESVEVEK